MYDNTESLCCTPETNIKYCMPITIQWKWRKKWQCIPAASVAILRGELPRLLSGKESITCQCRRCGFCPWVERSPGGGNSNPLQYSCLENPMDRGAWWAVVHGVTKGQPWPSDWAHVHAWKVGRVTFYLSNWISKLLMPFVTLDLLGKKRKGKEGWYPERWSKEECINPEDYCLKPK